MRTEIQNNTEQYEDDEIVLDLRGLFEDYLRCLKRWWLQLLLVLFTVTALAVTYFNRTYAPSYGARITYAVERTGDTGIDAALAKRLSLSVSTVTSLKDFREELTANVEEESKNDNYWFSSANTEGSNLFTVYIYANNYQNSNLLLENFKEVYPKWASDTVGTVELQIADESAAGKEPSNSYSLPMSAAKGALAGAALCVVIATVYALMNKTVQRENDMRAVTVKNCIATVPDTKVKKRVNSKREQLLVANKRVDWGFKQSILSMQSRIERQMEKEEKKVLLVSSTIPEEGKSLLALNLSMAFAMREKKVLLVDGDFRNPTIGRVLGLEAEHPGLSDYFRDQKSINDIIQTKNHVDVISAGTIRGEASSILSEKKMEDLMENLRNWYDYIFIDTPPVGLFTDGVILSGFADAVLYVVRHDKATTREIREGIHGYIQSDKLLGYVINRKPGGYSAYGKYGRYGGYRKYGKYRGYAALDEANMNTEDTL